MSKYEITDPELALLIIDLLSKEQIKDGEMPICDMITDELPTITIEFKDEQ